MSLFSTSLSGLNASSAALKSISNNLANMNTDGYKAQSAVFSDVFYQSYGNSGSGNPIQTGLGAQVVSTSQDLSNGALSSTGLSSNMALDGAGFFVTRSSTGADGYTRSGDFTTNSNGQLTTPGGQLVLGYPVVNGAVSTNSSLSPLNVGSGTTATANPTSKFALTTNLNSDAAVGDTFQSPISVYDSLGTAHVVTITYTKTATNTWSYAAAVPSGEITGATGTSTSVGSGTLKFDSTGALSSPTGSQTLKLSPLADGASSMSVAWQLTDSNGGSLLTQNSSKANNAATDQDGFAAGTLTSFSVLTDGTVEGTFSNGQTHSLGQVAVASFANPNGLSLSGGNQYSVTSASGAPVIGTAGTGGRGSIKGSTVEQSNVDVAKEFADLIVAQRSYEANAKAITAFDQVEQATIAMKN